MNFAVEKKLLNNIERGRGYQYCRENMDEKYIEEYSFACFSWPSPFYKISLLRHCCWHRYTHNCHFIKAESFLELLLGTEYVSLLHKLNTIQRFHFFMNRQFIVVHFSNWIRNLWISLISYLYLYIKRSSTWRQHWWMCLIRIQNAVNYNP